MVRRLINERKGWLRIVESFTTILLISVVLLLILNRSNYYEDEKSDLVADSEYAILREIQLNDSLRTEILGADVSNEIEWVDFGSSGLVKVRDKIIERTPGQLNCSAKLCSIDSACFFDNNLEKSVYVRSSVITANLTKYSPRELRLFCWEI